ncbi:hypothetical protein H7849_10960 [Alloacidobacterium dinghuense]|uniref:Uncharacterized protein n=1 Tax=Alloacidobacterium dinghuense TaxID=2763107 RepID=A0A7G8BP92_9BACT|nr:hypothetical protein [Alloacidobacterium dinghuense]QNI34362.1 hypothetical protein H7849_10960 [Alloacidobacterium dinghuense]
MTTTPKVLVWMVLLAAPLFAGAQEGEHVLHGHIGDQSYAFRMLPPTSFTELPAAIRSDLERRHCLIPQSYEARTPENVIRGAFREKGTSDWAALCSQNGTSTLLIYWSGSASKPAELAAQLDTDTADPHNETNMLGYARGIDPASPSSIAEVIANKTYGPFDHDGIRDAHIEKSSVIHYFKNGTWMTLAGSE